MYTLYIDTHFVNLVMGLFKDDELLAEKVISSNEHSKNTMLLLDNLLKEFKLDVKDLSEIIVVIGPGSFTGVRIGVVIAKILGYTLNIPIKEITYLEAMSLNYNEGVILGIKDRNGAFIGEFDDNHELIRDYYYLSNTELSDDKRNIVYDEGLDLLKVKKFVNKRKAIPPHLLKPLYVKKIEVGI